MRRRRSVPTSPKPETQEEETERDLAALPDPASARAALDRARSAAASRPAGGRREARAVDRPADLRGGEPRASGCHRSRSRRVPGANAREGATGQRAALLERRSASRRKSRAWRLARRQSPRRARRCGAHRRRLRRTAGARAMRWRSSETRLRESTEKSRLAEQALAEARERLARLEVLRDGADEASARLVREIRERVDVDAGGAWRSLPGSPRTKCRRIRPRRRRGSIDWSVSATAWARSI